MPSVANVVINDGATTPVAHTFSPIGKDDKGVMWFEQTLPVPVNGLGAKRLSYRQTRELNPNGRLTGRSLAIYQLFIPTLETLGNNSAGITPPPTVAYEEVARCEFRLAERSTKQERKDTRVMTVNLLGHAMAVANIDDLQVTF